LTIVGALIGVAIEIFTPWQEVVLPPIHAVLSDPSIAANPMLTSMIGLLGVLAGYLFLPLVGAAGGFFVDNAS
jgi:hypothetical protein